MRETRIALCQCRSGVGDPERDPRPDNVERLRQWAAQAKDAGAVLATFGELYLTGYRTDHSMHRYVVAPHNDDPWVGQLTAAARDLDLWLVVGTASSGGTVPGDMYNSAFLISPRGLVGVYRKTHVATFPIDDGTLATEGCFYSPGQEIGVHDTPFGTVGIQICYDVHFPEVSRVLALKGAEVIINLSAALAGYERFWDALLPVRAEENRIWYVMSSVVGQQRETVFFGGSRVVDPVGQLVARGTDHEEALVVADLTPDALARARQSSHRFSTRRPELYSVISEPTPYP